MRTYLSTFNARHSIVSTLGSVVLLAVMLFLLAACGGDGGGTTTSTTPITPTVAAPGVPTNFAVVKTPETTLSATVSWSPPTSGGAVATYEIYRSTTAGTVFSPDNHLISIPVVAGQTNYTFIDNAGLTAVETYWVVSAKNAGGETPTAEVPFTPTGSPTGGGGGGDTGYGNNFSAALVFADGLGISGLALDPSKAWTPPGTDVSLIDYNTGLRPLSGESTTAGFTTLPYFDPTTTYPPDPTFYEQQTASTWQGQWVNGASAPQYVTAKWGDNLVSQSLSANSTIRIEMVLSKVLLAPMTSYTMKSLYGAKANEIQGTDGSTYENLTAFVFAANAHLTIQKLDATGAAVGLPLYDQTLWAGDGPGFLAGEVNVAGNFTYGFVWNLKNQVLPPDIPSKTGTWRLTFSLDATSPKGTPNNTFIETVGNGVLDNPAQVHIDINVQ